jgi:NADP-dependent 3-hydroxy acid dehydrogenase YdfG
LEIHPNHWHEKGMPNPPVSLQGKKALVTGASSGIGQAIAMALSREGSAVALLARREERLSALSDAIGAAGGIAYGIPVDLSRTDLAQDAVHMAASSLDGLDIVINAAGVARQAKLTDGLIEDWKTMLEVNVLALSIVTREALPYLPADGGHIVNISSMSGHRVPGKGGFYAATKFAVRALTEGLRQELRAAGNLTRVSSISPGFVDTELLDEYFNSGGNDRAKYEAIDYPILQPGEIADLVIHQLKMPATAEVTDILVRPTAQAS